MKNWQPVPHFGVKVLATYLLGYLATNLTVFAITWQANLSANTANNLMKLSCALTLLALSRWWLHLPLFKRPQHVSKAALIVLMIISLNLVTPNLHWGLFATALVNSLCVGLLEEATSRGPILFWLWSKTPSRCSPYWWTAITSGIGFGLLHLTNYVANPDWIQILIQVGYAAVIGFTFAGLFMYTHNLWFTIIAHSGFDTISGMNEVTVSHVGWNVPEVASLLLVVTVCLLIGIWLMKQLTGKHHDLQF
ncbi:CPBP family intramembrane glutamic endopeptidase [Lacticaseibacillus manihotivorans]|nr:CPBP family intramembrane glutamic endopeptidase [Lacticaseibacillus manihotivorans]